MIKGTLQENKIALGFAVVLLALTYGLRWSFIAYDNSQAKSRVSEAITDQAKAKSALTEFRQKNKPAPKIKIDFEGLIAAFQLSSSQLSHLDRTLDTLPFLMDCGAADTWLDSRVQFHESEALGFPEGSDTLGHSIQDAILRQIKGLDIKLDKNCDEFPCLFTMYTDTIPIQVLERFYDELTLEYETLMIERPNCEDCPEQFLSFGAAMDPIPDSAFRRLRWRKNHGENR